MSAIRPLFGKNAVVPIFIHMGNAIKFLVGKNTAVPILTGRLKGKKWIIGVGIEQVLGTWEERYTRAFEDSVSPSSVVYDVGAAGGWYTLLASQLVGDKGKVIAFEPLLSVLPYLRRHVELNHCCNVQILEAAVSDTEGTATFFANAGGQLGSLLPDYGSDEMAVQTVTVDSLVQREIIPVPDFIKMDIEGGELAALRGAESTLVNYAPMLFLETHFDLYTKCRDLLRSFGYTLTTLSERPEAPGSIIAWK